MLKLIIEDDEGRKTVVPFARDEITVGRQEGNTIRLTERNVSRRHARLRRVNGHVVVEDLGSSYGIRLNGERIQGEAPLKDGDLLQIGDYDFALQGEVAAPAPPPPPPREQTVTAVAAPSFADSEGEETTGSAALAAAGVTASAEPPAPAPGTRGHPLSTAVIRSDAAPPAVQGVQALEPEEAPRLLVLNTELAGREFACIRTDLRIGRADENDISIDHRSLSRTHARLVREPQGDWCLVDLQSSNGLLVNGERYGRVTLKSGDVVELGHVRLRFLAAGERGEVKGARGAGRLLAGVGVLLVALAAGLGGVALWRPALLEGLLPASVQAPTPVPGTVAQAAPPGEAPASPAPPAPAAAPLTGEVLARFQAAEQAVAGRDFEQATRLLDAVPAPQPPQVVALRAEVAAEVSARQHLSEAQSLLQGGQLEEAAARVEAAAGTRAWAGELATVRERLARAQAAAAAASQAEAAVRAQQEAERRAQVMALYAEAREALKKGQARKAEVGFKKCLALDATAAVCHLGLGGTYARMAGKAELGASHYRKFLEAAPDDPSAPQVRKLLADYENARRAVQPE